MGKQAVLYIPVESVNEFNFWARAFGAVFQN